MFSINSADRVSATPRPKIPGQFLARNKWTPARRALVAVHIIDEKVDVWPLCKKQVAQLCRVSLSRVYRARRNGNGRRGNGNGRRATESLADHITRSTAVERVEAARKIGVDVVWNTFIEPVISAEKTAAE